MKQEPLVRLLGVTKEISSKVLVDDVTFDIAPGQIFGFLGPNGAGKTTTIRMMVGLMSITQGDITIGDTAFGKIMSRLLPRSGRSLRIRKCTSFYPVTII